MTRSQVGKLVTFQCQHGPRIIATGERLPYICSRPMAGPAGARLCRAPAAHVGSVSQARLDLMNDRHAVAGIYRA
jgi:hypothetical protein